jgi:hypothetical protein
MTVSEYLALFARVLSDWRVPFIAVATILAWAALRYVGMVYDRRPRRAPAPPRAPRQPRPPRPRAGASRTAAPAAGEEEETAE